jgi:hypothetical protein
VLQLNDVLGRVRSKPLSKVDADGPGQYSQSPYGY